MSHLQTPFRTPLSPCPVRGRIAGAAPTVSVGADRAQVGRLNEIADITAAVFSRASQSTEGSAPTDLPVDLPAVCTEVAAVATRRFTNRVLTFVPQALLDPDLPLGSPSSPDASTPDVCVPVAVPGPADGGVAVGHLHLTCPDAFGPDAGDLVTVELLAGYAVDIATSREHERDQSETIAALRRQLAAARDEAAHLTVALESNREIGVAIGIIAAVDKVTADEAFTRMRDASQNSNRKLREIAADVVFTGTTPRSGRIGYSHRSATLRQRIERGTGDADPEVRNARRHTVDLTMRRDRIAVRLDGELDLAARDDLTWLLHQLAALTAPVHCDTRDVTFADSHGLGPLIDDAERRLRSGVAPILLAATSCPVRTVVRYLGVDELFAPRRPTAQHWSSPARASTPPTPRSNRHWTTG